MARKLTQFCYLLNSLRKTLLGKISGILKMQSINRLFRHKDTLFVTYFDEGVLLWLFRNQPNDAFQKLAQ